MRGISRLLFPPLFSYTTLEKEESNFKWEQNTHEVLLHEKTSGLNFYSWKALVKDAYKYPALKAT